MKKNIVFIPNVSTDDGSTDGGERSNSYFYSVKSWTEWAKQYKNIEVVKWTDPILDPKILSDWILKDNLKVRLQMQLHKYIWSHEKKGV